MNWNVILPLAGVAVAILGYIISYLIAKRKAEEVIIGKFATTEFLEKIKNIDQFIKSTETKEIVQIIKKLRPEELAAFNRTYRTIEDRLKTFSDSLGSMRRLIEAQVFNEVNGRIHGYIENNTKFIERLGEAKDSKIYLAKYILKTPILEHVIDEGKPIFIESGSTYAYLILQLIDYVNNLRQNENAYQLKKKPLVVCTNNVSIYIILLFEEWFSPFLLPGKPTNQYAATFGDPIKTDIFSEIEAQKFLDHHKVTTLLSTASFLDIKYGPHVSSLPNWQMKRFLNKYSTEKKCRHIFVITSDKLNNNVYNHAVKENCKLIFHEPDREEEELVSYKNLSKEDLEKVHLNFKNFLTSENNYIITASADKKLCEGQVNALMNNFSDILKRWTVDFDKGLLAVLNHKNIPL